MTAVTCPANTYFRHVDSLRLHSESTGLARRFSGSAPEKDEDELEDRARRIILRCRQEDSQPPHCSSPAMRFALDSAPARWVCADPPMARILALLIPGNP